MPYAPVGSSLKPIMLFMHGGGWIRGTLEMYDPLTRGFALKMQDFIVVSVEYRLAPETKFPGALSDCLQALRWVAERGVHFGGDTSRIALAGDSAGGNLAIALAMLAQAEMAKGTGAQNVTLLPGVKLCANAFIYPVTDYSMSSASYEEFALGPGRLTRASMESYWRAYLQYPLVQGRDPLASPSLAHADHISGFAPTLMLTAESDPLRDEGEAFADKLSAAGVSEVKKKRYAGVTHGFVSRSAGAGDFNHDVWKDVTEFLHAHCGAPTP
ncbi:Alpha/beta hydrolase fold-3 [Tribonema minus]|uniref:Alpha/beta hydrolase fold-3 n=1 Tax=Tribonema minus TaxID=303371 RepID=A0A835YVD9_9STRA|nr:Alpha/beta hydrolase fold-3 [Tribonema minus]